MDVLKGQMINHILSFISKREREVRKSDLFDEIMRQFGSELKDKCDDNPFADEMFAESVIHETYLLYGLTYIEKDDELIGLKEEGYKAANYPNGIVGYLDDKEKERKSLELRSRFQFWAEIIATAIAGVGLFVNLISPNTIWLNNIGYLACGIVICFVATRIIRTVANKLEI